MAHSRGRYREVVHPIFGWRRSYPPGVPEGGSPEYPHGDGTYKIQRYFEVIEDVVGSADRVHPVRHNTTTVVAKPLPNRFHDSGWSEYNHNIYFEIPSGTVEPLLLSATHLDLGELSDKAYDALWPQVPQEVSIPNFLYELRELKDLIPALAENISKTLSGGYLQYQFGYKPFIGDVQKLVSIMSTIRARLEFLRRTYGKETRISCQFAIEVDSLAAASAGGFSWSLTGRGIFRAGGYLYHELQDLDGLIGEFRALLGATGFNNPLAVLWEAIPFSFVADWFTRAGSLIGRTPIQPFVGPWEIRRLTHSVDIAGDLIGRLDWGGGYTPPGYAAFEVKVKLYERGVGLPASSSLLYEDGLNPQQQALGAALIASSARH